jgi:hypothetical protein
MVLFSASDRLILKSRAINSQIKQTRVTKARKKIVKRPITDTKGNASVTSGTALIGTALPCVSVVV